MILAYDIFLIIEFRGVPIANGIMEPPSSPTPPLPIRAPGHCLHPLSAPLPPIPHTPSTVGLMPSPLFSKKRPRRTIMPPDTIHVAVLEMPSHSTPPASPSSGWDHSSQTSSPPNSPSSRPRSLSCISSTSSFIEWGSSPMHALRRKPSPKRDTLRALRAKDSDASLQRIYENQTSAYLNGNLFGRPNGLSRLGVEIGD